MWGWQAKYLCVGLGLNEIYCLKVGEVYTFAFAMPGYKFVWTDLDCLRIDLNLSR